MEFDANNALKKSQYGKYFYDSLKPLIKSWIANIRDDMPWDDLVNISNKVKARAKIQKVPT